MGRVIRAPKGMRRASDRLYQIDSFKQKDTRYLMAWDPARRRWKCGCAHWIFQREPKAACKHIKRLRAHLKDRALAAAA